MAFYAKKWQSWEKEQPEWCDEEFKESVPRELPPVRFLPTLRC